MGRLYRALAVMLVAGLAAAAAQNAAPAAATKAPRPTEAIEPKGCVTAECHANVKSSRVVHGPLVVDACDSCHTLTSAKDHTFVPARQGAELCTFCHEFDVSRMPVVHAPVAEGQCVGCHSAHGGETHDMLRESTMSELCGRCHETAAMSRTFMHTPVARGACDSCHPAHGARFPKLLDATGPDLCLRCHTDFDTRMARVKFSHKAMDDGCTRCHDAHGSNQPMALREGQIGLCLGCHEKVKGELAAATYKHSVVTKDRACMSCHTPHGGDVPKLMTELPSKVCTDCHNKAVKADSGRTIAPVTEVTDAKQFKHGPVKDGQCGGCHTPHGSPRPMLLSRNYSDALYQRYAPEQYEFCFSCHDPRLVEQKEVQGVTMFRNGTQNLHYVHVREGKRARNCAMCHSTHASKHERIIQDKVQMKKWQMPINFARTGTGGSCVPGCHVYYPYDREKPFPPPTTRPFDGQTTMPTFFNPPPTMVVRGPSEDPPPLRWSGKDATGADVTVPAPAGRPTVVAFAMAGSPDNAAVWEQVAAAVPADGGKAQVVVVLGGAQAHSDAVAMVASRPAARADWQVVADLPGVIAARADVRGWPTVIVLRNDGTQVARVNGAAGSLALKLAPYVALAAGTIDKASVERDLARRETVEDSPAWKASWPVQQAEKLLADGKVEQARQLLSEAMKARPDSTPLKVAMAKALASAKRDVEAIELVNRLPADAMPPAQVVLLRGKLLVMAERWDQGRDVLAGVLKEHPELAEAHFLMGQIHEHDGDWQKAAQSYRAYHDARRK